LKKDKQDFFGVTPYGHWTRRQHADNAETYFRDIYARKLNEIEPNKVLAAQEQKRPVMSMTR